MSLPSADWLPPQRPGWRLKPFFSLMKERINLNRGLQETRLLSLSYGRIVEKDITGNSGLLPASFEGYNVVEPNDIVMRLTDLQNDQRSLRTGLVNERGIITSAYVTVVPSDEMDSRFAHYLLHGYDLAKVFYGMGGGLRQSMRYADLKRLPLTLPLIGEQKCIANFLDAQTARIDALIAGKETLLYRVQELFNSKLGHAIVAGIPGRGNLVPATDKGFEQVREDWDLVPLKYLVKPSGGMTPSKERPEYWDGDIPWVSPKDMKRFVLADSIDHVTQDALAGTSLKLHSENSVLIVVRGMILAHTFPVAINSVPVTINQDMKALTPSRRVTPRYLAWMLRGLQSLMLALTEESAHGTKALRTDQWEAQSVPVPTLDEQDELVRLFEEQERRTAALCSHLSTHIDRLREYRSSLISAAVTGQIDINNFQLEAAA